MKVLLTIATLMVAGIATAQQPPHVVARIEPDSIGIGDRFEYVIEVEKDQVQVVVFPEFTKQMQGLEVVRSYPVDTLERNGRLQKLRKRYEMAAFEQGHFNLGRAAVLYADKNIMDTLYHRGDSLRLEVGTFQIDTTTQTIYDVKAQRRLPFRFGEVSGYVIWGLLGLGLLAAALYVLMRWLARRGRTLGDLFKPTPPLPAHVAAIKALEELHNQKLWQNNRHKQYYSGLTDILRTYIAARYDIGAMEMTSDEIVTTMGRIEGLSLKSTSDLTSILRTADLVKFAKAMPEAEENEADYYKAYYFVEETKPQDAQTGDPDAMQNK